MCRYAKLKGFILMFNTRIKFTPKSIQVDTGNQVAFAPTDLTVETLKTKLMAEGYDIASEKKNGVALGVVMNYIPIMVVKLYQDLKALGYTPRIESDINAPKTGNPAWAMQFIGPTEAYRADTVRHIKFITEGYDEPTIEVFLDALSKPITVPLALLLERPDCIMSLEFHYPGKLQQALERLEG